MLNGDSHQGEDQKLLLGYFLLVAMWLELIIRFAHPAVKTLMNSTDASKVTVFVSLMLLGVAYFYRLIHLSLYYTNGQGLYCFELLYLVLKSACEFVISTMLVALGWGWSLTHLRHDQSYIVAGAVATLINIAGLVVNLLAEQLVDVHHKYDSTAGYILQFLRVVILLIFLLGVARSLNFSAGTVRRFIKRLAYLGALYLLSWPLIVLFSELFLPNYMHNEVITFVEQVTHILTTRFICKMLAYPQSQYRKISIKVDDNPLKMQDYKVN